MILVDTIGELAAVWGLADVAYVGGSLSAGRGGFPIGPMFAVPGRGSIVYAAWTEEFPGSLFGGFPVTLATHGREITEDVVSERGVTTGLAMTSHGPELAANEWVAADNFSFSFPAPDAVWAGTVTGSGGSELDGRLAGLAAVPHSGSQDLLLSRPDGLWWFRSRSLPVHVSLSAEPRDDGTVALSGRVQGARGGHVTPLTLSDRLRPPGVGFGVGWIHVYPTSLFGDALAQAEDLVVRAVHALGLRDGIAFPQLLASPDGLRVIEVAARIPGGEMAQLAAHAVGVDLVEVALQQALGEEVPDALVKPSFQQPLAIRFLTAEPGPLPAGTVRRIGSLEKVLAFPGVVEADTYLSVGETINPVRLDGDRRGYVIATGDTNLEALERAEAAARLVDIEVW